MIEKPRNKAKRRETERKEESREGTGQRPGCSNWHERGNSRGRPQTSKQTRTTTSNRRRRRGRRGRGKDGYERPRERNRRKGMEPEQWRNPEEEKLGKLNRRGRWSPGPQPQKSKDLLAERWRLGHAGRLPEHLPVAARCQEPGGVRAALSWHRRHRY